MSTAENTGAPSVVADTSPDSSEAHKKERAGGRRLLRVLGLFLVVVVVGVTWRVWTAGDVRTDDATVEADVVAVTAQVGGQVAQVLVTDNARVKQGDPLVQLDTVELDARVRQAEGELAAAVAQADAADAQERVSSAAARGGLSSAEAQVGSSRAQVASAEAQLARAQSDAAKSAADLARATTLLEGGAITQERYDAVRSANEASAASLQAAQSALELARSRVSEAAGALDVNAPLDDKIAAAHANADLAHARVRTAQAAADLARLALSRATIIAPRDGTLSKFSVRQGQVIPLGQQVGFLVPDESYIVANFKETQIEHMRPGQPVDVEIDGFSGRTFTAAVESLSAATGSRFSVLAPDNASGNFVKVVQRVPVRIRFDEALGEALPRPGMSAVVTVHTD